MAILAGVFQLMMTEGASGWSALFSAVFAILALGILRVFYNIWIAPAATERAGTDFLSDAYARSQKSLVQANATIKELEVALRPPVEVVGVRAISSGEDLASVIFVQVANYGGTMASGVEITIDVWYEGSGVNFQGPRKKDVPPGGVPEEIEMPVSIRLSAPLTVSGTVAHSGETRAYCFKYREWPYGERPEGVAQFVRCDDNTLRNFTLSARASGDSTATAKPTVAR